MGLPWSYTSRLARDLADWHEKGWVTEAGQQAIVREVANRRHGPGLAGSLAVLGACLLGFSAMTFVASNWQDMTKLARLALLTAGMWTAYGGAAVLFSRKLDLFGHAAVLAGVSIFGAGIMLVAQMYHMEGNPPDAVLMWAAGALLAGLAFRSNPALALAMLLVGLWSSWEMSLTQGVHWGFLAGWVAVAAAFFWTRWRPGLHLSALAMSAWIVTLGHRLPFGPHNDLVAALGFAVAAGAVFGGMRFHDRFAGRIGRIAPSAIVYGLGVGFFGLLLLQFERTIPVGRLIVLAVLTLALVIAVISMAMRTDNRAALWVGYAAFAAEILALYFRTLGTLLNTSLFFFVAGLLVIALSTIAYRLHASTTARIGGTP